MVSTIKKSIAQFSYSDQLSAGALHDLAIKLPLKPNTDPNKYTQDDIDWEYIECFMENMQNKAASRLDKLSVNFTN